MGCWSRCAPSPLPPEAAAVPIQHTPHAPPVPRPSLHAPLPQSPSPTNPFNARHLYLCGGGEYSGTVLKVVFAWGYGDCCNKCKETPECTRFTSLDYTCTLKSGTDYKTEAGFGGWSGRLVGAGDKMPPPMRFWQRAQRRLAASSRPPLQAQWMNS